MSAETNQELDQVKEEEENSKTTPDRPQFSPILPTGNVEIDNDFGTAEIKTESLDNQEKEIESKTQDTGITANCDSSDNTEKIQEPPTITTVEHHEFLAPNPVEIKEESFNEENNVIDYGMPIAKTPLRVDDTLDNLTFDMETPRILPLSIANAGNNMKLDEDPTKSALDAYLDGIETPLAPVRPRLRVKPEFTLQNEALRMFPSEQISLNNENDSMNCEISSPPPPPPLISSNSNANFVAEGITTPRLSLAAINRVRIKTELSVQPSTSQYNEDSSSLAPMADETQDKETGELSSNSEDLSEAESIPPDFFDDLLEDKSRRIIEESQNFENEEKYSDKIKELERLRKEKEIMKKNSKERHKSRKKQKKSKKKSRKRSRSRSLSPGKKTRDRCTEGDLSNFYNHDKHKRTRRSPSLQEMPTSSIFVNNELMEENCLRVNSGVKIKTEIPSTDLKNLTNGAQSIAENIEEAVEVLTPKQKKERAIKRATSLLNHLKDYSDDNSKIFSSFPFVSTVRKLPTSHLYVQQQIYENRSPLHTVNNVSYKFNSHATRFNMEEWGLAALPTHAAKMAKLVGCNAQYIHDKLKTMKIPAKLKKVKQGSNKEDASEEEELIETLSSLYSNAMTQTDDICEFDVSRKAKGYEIGVQVEPSVYSIGCQTLETQSPTENLHKDDEAPIINIIRDLNENQLMAIHAFAELIKEPNTNTNAMEMYKMQRQFLDIYKMSQIPSALATTETTAMNSYKTKTNNSPPQRINAINPREQPKQPIIQSIRGADGTFMVRNDPRSRSAAYAQRNINDGAGSASSYDPSYSGFSQSDHGKATPNDNYSKPSYKREFSAYNHQAAATAKKHYGRGGLRR